MVRGTTLFICTQCKKVFLAPDIEYDAMCLSVPMPCERCGSRRTLPMKLDLFAFSDKLNPNKPLKEQLLYYSSYEEIWKRMPSVHIEQGGTPDEQYRIGMEYLNGTRLSYHDSDIAFYWLMKAARRGHVRAQYQVGRLLRHRPPVPKYLQNPPFCYTEGTAYQWMTQAAGQGLPEAMCGLANMVGKYNPKKAFALHMKAAMSGYAESEYAIACLYEQGEGVEQNPFRALRWCRKAALHGYAEAQLRLGIVYESTGKERHLHTAVTFYQQAAQQHTLEAWLRLAALYEVRKGEQDLQKAWECYVNAWEAGDENAYKEAKRLADEGQANLDASTLMAWYRKCISHGHREAWYNLGKMYHEGRGLERNLKEARQCYLFATRTAHVAEAQYALGCMYEQGEGTQPDLQEAIRWYKEAANQGHTEAQAACRRLQVYEPREGFETWQQLVLFYEVGKGEQDWQKLWECYVNAWEAGNENAYQEAKRLMDEGRVKPDLSTLEEWYRKCIAHGHREAWYNLGKMYHEGRGLERNLKEARQCYLFAARTSHVAEAQYALGCMYEQGEGTQPDLQEAIRWYKEAADQGHTEAQAACRRLADDDDRKQ